MENENKKPQVIIVGAGPEDKDGTGRIALYIAGLKEKHEVIFVDTLEKAKELTGLDLELGKMPTLVVDDLKENPFRNPPLKFERLPEYKVPFMDMTEHNPWPSPKGRKGKRRW
jgi:hypothetical protein